MAHVETTPTFTVKQPAAIPTAAPVSFVPPEGTIFIVRGGQLVPQPFSTGAVSAGFKWGAVAIGVILFFIVIIIIAAIYSSSTSKQSGTTGGNKKNH
jgi:hypothetical protein